MNSCGRKSLFSPSGVFAEKAQDSQSTLQVAGTNKTKLATSSGCKTTKKQKQHATLLCQEKV